MRTERRSNAPALKRQRVRHQKRKAGSVVADADTCDFRTPPHSDRIAAAVARLRLRSDDDVLEIGCGHGVAVSLICQQLRTGRVLALDRSAKMIAAARRRNRAFVARGLAEFIVTDLVDFDPGDRKFDAILALRVRALQSSSGPVWEQVKRWLKPRGRVVFEYDRP
jgi:Methylase involved in ubiquinone/menaquinone biosynthesis